MRGGGLVKKFLGVVLSISLFLTMSIVVSRATEIEDLNDTVSLRQTTIDTLVKEVEALAQITQKYKSESLLIPSIENNVVRVESNKEVIALLTDEIMAVMHLVPRLKLEIELKEKMDENIAKIEYLQQKIDLIMAELEGINKVIIAVRGRNKFYCAKGAVFSLLITGKNIKTDVGAEVIIKYDSTYYQVLDLVGITPEKELSTVHIESYGIEVKNHNATEGEITMELTKNEITGELWSGILNSIKFECIKEANSGIDITINEK